MRHGWTDLQFIRINRDFGALDGRLARTMSRLARYWHLRIMAGGWHHGTTP